jgi:hypothetical protein
METIRYRRAVATAGALLALLAGAAGKDKKGEPFTMMSIEEVERVVGKPDVFVVDANPEDVFRKNHLPGARWWRSAPLAQLLPAQKETQLVFYCASPS